MQRSFDFEPQTADFIPTETVLPAIQSTPCLPLAEAKRAASFRKIAQTYDRQAEDRLKRADQASRNTARRLNIARGMEKDGQNFQELALFYRNLAKAVEEKSLPPILKHVRSKPVIESLRASAHWPWSYKVQLIQAHRAEGITEANIAEAHAAIQQYREEPKPDPNRKIRELEDELVGCTIEGYFPTPPEIVTRMLKLAELRPGLRVLEPSAGKGNICDGIRATGLDVKLSVIEPNERLREILTLKGYNLVGHNFLDHDREYHVVIMNPPFEAAQDISHVQKAFQLLEPGGRLVSIVSESCFFRNERKYTEFRQWLEAVGGVSEKLPVGAFAKGERPTNVNTRIVILNCPSET